MKKIKVLHIAEAAGGVDVYLKMLFRNMDRTRISNVFICSQHFNTKDYELFTDELVPVNMPRSFNKQFFTSIATIRKEIRHINPDIIYCHSSIGGGLGRLAAIGMGKIVVYNPHGWAFKMRGSRLKRLVFLLLERFLAHFTTRIICVSNAEKLSAIEHRIAKSTKIQTIFNGVDIHNIQTDTTTVSRTALGIAENAVVIGMVGRITPQKAPDTFVLAATEIKKQIPESYFIIVGDGEEREKIEQMIHERGLSDSFSITGWVNNPLAYAQLFDIAVLLSRWEGFGLVLAEYMVLNKPIIATATATDAIPDLITDCYNGLLVEIVTLKSLRAALFAKTVIMFPAAMRTVHLLVNQSITTT